MKPIPGFSDYCITKDGRIWSSPRIDSLGHNRKGKWLKGTINSGYCRVLLTADSKQHLCSVHRLVLETYVGLCPVGMECRHLNGLRIDNRLENLCWGTKRENSLDSIRHGTHVGLNRRGEKNSRAKLTEQDVRMIIYMCRTGSFLQREIAKIYNLSRQHIGAIVNRINWKHLYA